MSVQNIKDLLSAIAAFLFQIARIGAGALGLLELWDPHGDKTIGWTLLAVSGITAGLDVAKVHSDIQAALETPAPIPGPK